MQILNFLQENAHLTLGLVGLLGLLIGSFLNVVIHRTPKIMFREFRQNLVEFLTEQEDIDQTHVNAIGDTIKKDKPISLSFPPSRCPNCNHQIRFYENIPVISWLVLRGKCSSCESPISWRYPLVEILTAITSVMFVYVLGVNAQGLFGLVYLWILIALTGIDLDTQYLPDRLVFPLGMLGLALNTQNIFTSTNSAVWGALLGFTSFWSVASLYAFLMKKEGMGGGDFKLLAALGAWLGVGMLPFLILTSSILGSVFGLYQKYSSGNSRFAFGPAIAIAGIIALLWGEKIVQWYLNISHLA